MPLSNPWQLIDSLAQVHVGGLRARVDLKSPYMGLHTLAWNDQLIDGKLLGIAIDGGSASNVLQTTNMEQYVRGSDLVANYPQFDVQKFTLHVYWRVNDSERAIATVDAIVSIQTSLLECYPKVRLTTSLGQFQDWQTVDASDLACETDEVDPDSNIGGMLVRAADEAWSYFEMTHPADLGECRMAESDGGITIERELGGEFQEKGVIRRLRVRAAFLPRNNDVETARRLMREFCLAPPPLTA